MNDPQLLSMTATLPAKRRTDRPKLSFSDCFGKEAKMRNALDQIVFLAGMVMTTYQWRQPRK